MTAAHRSTLVGLIALTLVAGAVRGQTFYEQDGLVVVECESVPPGDGWALRTGSYTLKGSNTVAGYTGNGCYHLTSGSEKSGSVRGIMTYKINIINPGSYRLYMRGMEAPIESGAGDQANDCYIKMSNQSGCEGKFTKYVRLGASYEWTFGIRLECSHHSFSDAKYELSAGEHTFQIAGRSKNFLIDRFVLINTAVSNADPKDLSLPQSSMDGGTVPVPPPPSGGEAVVLKAVDFDEKGDFYVNNDWLAINPLQDADKRATATKPFPGEDGVYDVTMYGVGEEDGESMYKLWVDGVLIGEYQVPTTTKSFAEGDAFNKTWTGVSVKTGDVVKIEATAHSNGTIPEAGAPGGHAWSRGRWSQIDFVPDDASGSNPPPGDQTVLIEPSSGTTLLMGSTVTLTGTGSDLAWSYDANSDGKGEIPIGTGEQVSFTVPSGITGPMEITIKLTGSSGTVERTLSLTSETTSVHRRQQRAIPFATSDAGTRYSVDGRRVEARDGRHGPAMSPSVIRQGSNARLIMRK